MSSISEWMSLASHIQKLYSVAPEYPGAVNSGLVPTHHCSENGGPESVHGWGNPAFHKPVWVPPPLS